MTVVAVATVPTKGQRDLGSSSFISRMNPSCLFAHAALQPEWWAQLAGTFFQLSGLAASCRGHL